ncbi:hypothetical protein ACXYMO_03050 [Arenibacterium sp. CAU 1754]
MGVDPVIEPEQERPPRRRGRWRRATVFTLAVLICGVAGTIYFLIGQTIRAPDWLRDRIETRIERELGDFRIDFADVQFVLRKGWRPRVRLRGVSLLQLDGHPLVELSNIEASLAMRPLLKGQVQPKRISLSGAFATLRRDAEGNLSLLFGDNASPFNSAANLPQLIERSDQILTSPQFSALTDIDIDSLNLRFEDMRQNRAWTLDGGRIQLLRARDQLQLTSNFSLLSGGSYASLIEANYASRIGETRAEFGISIQDIAAPDIAAQSVALTWLEVLRAPISGALRGSVDDSGALGPLSATLQIGAGVLQPNDQARPIPFDGARSYFTYDPAQSMLVFDELSVSSAWGSGLAEGRAYLGGVETGRLTELTGQFNFSDITLNPDDLYTDPLKIEKAAADFRLRLDPFSLKLGQMNLTTQGSLVRLSGGLDAGPEGWVIAMDGEMDHLTPDRLLKLWPERAATNPRKWVAANLRGGLLRDLNVAVRLKPGAKPGIVADFDFQNAEIKYLKTLPPITNATGQASLTRSRFVVSATSGQVIADSGGPIDIAGTSFIIPDIGIRQEAPAVVRLTGAGSVTSFMSLLDRPPLSVFKDTPFGADVALGNARITGTLSLPLKPKIDYDELEFHFDGTARDVSSVALVPDHVLTAQALRITGDQTRIAVSGQGEIDGIPADVVWRQPIGKGVPKDSRVEGTITLSQKLVDTFGIGLPRGTVSGSGSGRFRLDLSPGAPPVLGLTSDLRGLTLRLPQIGWTKSARAKGLLQISGTLGQVARINNLVLQGAGLSATGAVLNRPSGGLERALFSSVRMGDWLNAQVEMVGRGNAPPELRILGGSLDMRRADFGDGGGGAGAATSGTMQIALDRLQITDTIALTGFNGAFQTAGGLDGNFTGKVNGQTAVTGELIPQAAGRYAVRVKANDAGGVFRSAGVLKQGRGGDFNLTLVPAQEIGQFNGVLRVTNTRVKDAPAIAALLNSISVIGLLDEMSGQGIQFTEVDAKFRLGPSRLTLLSSSAVGPSIGLSMDGLYDVQSGRLNMQGVISPVYLLNSIGSILTRKGEGLLGFSYKLRGTAQDPSVSVNPLSALAPGLLREVFRAPPPAVEGETPSRGPTRSAPNPYDDDGVGGR